MNRFPSMWCASSRAYDSGNIFLRSPIQMTFLDLLVGNQSRFRYAKADEATTSLRHLIHRHVGRVPIHGFERTPCGA